MSHNVCRACRIAGLLAAWSCLAVLAGAQGPPATPAKGTPAVQPPPATTPPLYPGLEPNPYAFGQVPPGGRDNDEPPNPLLAITPGEVSAV